MLYLGVLNKTLHRIYLAGFWIYHVFKVCQGSEYARFHQENTAWQGTDYFSRSAYTRVLSMPGLYKALKKILHHRCLTGFQIFLRFWTCHGFKYARVTQAFEQNTPLEIFDRVLNMHLVLKWQGYRKFSVNCILEIHVILNMSQGSQYTKILHATGILIC